MVFKEEFKISCDFLKDLVYYFLNSGHGLKFVVLNHILDKFKP